MTGSKKFTKKQKLRHANMLHFMKPNKIIEIP